MHGHGVENARHTFTSDHYDNGHCECNVALPFESHGNPFSKDLELLFWQI